MNFYNNRKKFDGRGPGLALKADEFQLKICEFESKWHFLDQILKLVHNQKIYMNEIL